MQDSYNASQMDRRRFLKMSGMLGLAAATATVVPLSGSFAFDRQLQKVTRTANSMGTFVAVTVLHPSATKADEAIGAAFEQMRRVAAIFDRYNSSSAISVLNKDGVLTDAPTELVEMAAKANSFHGATSGAFDATVAPVVDLYRQSFATKAAPPSAKELQKAVDLVNGKGLFVSGSTIKLARQGMALTFDGIAKGFVIDAGANELARHGVQYALINAGGDIRAIGGKGLDRAWTVAIRNPAQGDYLDKINLNNGAVATSGNYEIHFDREKLFHHIVNPGTGASPAASQSVTVTAADVTTADALSTAVFVMGPKRGIEFVNSLPNSQTLILTRSGSKHISSGWQSA
jgi:thiamine biosynthesis lipoprotein